MARREWQEPSLLTRDGKGGEQWYIRYRVHVRVGGENGKPKLERREKFHFIGLVKAGANAKNPDALTEKQALQKRAAILAEVNNQVYTVQSKIPWEDFCRLFKEKHLPKLAVPTQLTYEKQLRLYIEPAFRGKELGSIGVMDCDQFLNSLPLSSLTKHSMRGVLSSVFDLAIRWGYLDETRRNPVSLVELPPPRPVREKVLLTPAELDALLAVVRPDVRLILETMVYTGMRISECLGLRWQNVDTERGIVFVVERRCRGDVGAPKSVKGRRPLPLGMLARKFDEYRNGAADDALVFYDWKTGQPYTDDGLLNGALNPALKALGLKKPGLGFHAFRRFHATYISREISVFEASAQMGHADAKTTALYVLPDMARREEAVRRMQERLMGKAMSATAGAVN